MAGYSVPPTYGGQYNGTPYGQPPPPSYQHLGSSFNSMMSNGPQGPPQYGQPQQSYAPSNYAPSTSQAPYTASVAYQNNAPYHPQQYGQPSYPPFPPYYNNYNAFNSNSMYQAGYNGNTQNMPPNGNGESLSSSQIQDQPPQNIDPISEAARAAESSSFADGVDINRQSEPNFKNFSGLSKIDTSISVDQLNLTHQAQGQDTQMRDEGVVTTSDESEQDPTPMQLQSASTEQSTSDRVADLTRTQGSPDNSEQSFDPYSTEVLPQKVKVPGESFPTEPAPKTLPSRHLPGLGTPQSPVIAQKSDMEAQRQEKKSLAIQAIQDLASRKIGFNQISEEGIDATLLRELYLESGVPLDFPKEQQLSNNVPTNDVSHTAKPAKSAAVNKSASAKVDPPSITAVPNFNLPMNLPAKSKTTDTVGAITVKPTVDSPGAGSVPSRQDYLAKLQAAKDAVKNKPVQPPTTSQPMDRTDYLAKLQAAREAVKQSSSVKPSSPSQAIHPHGATLRPEMSVIPVSTPASSPARANLDEILRKKLEALRAAQSSGTSSHQQDNSNSASMSTISQSNQNLQTTSTKSAADNGPSQTSMRKNSTGHMLDSGVSFFAPSSSQSPGGLPGLSVLPGLSFGTMKPVTQETNRVPEARTSPAVVISKPENHLDAQIIVTPPVSDRFKRDLEQRSSSEPQTSRKRPVATDFIDGPPAKIRSPNPSRPTSRPTDLSDGEIEPTTVSERQGRRQTSLQYRAQPDLPHRSNYSGRSKSRSIGPQVIPPDLQAKEDEIRALKQRIQEATLKRGGKSSGNRSSKTPVTAEATSLEQAQTLEDKQAAIKDGTQELTAQEKALAAAKLQAQKHLETIRRNQASLTVHANKAQLAVEQASTESERGQRIQRKADLEAKLSIIEANMTTTEADLFLIKQEQDKLTERIERDTQARSVLMDELTQLLQSLDAEAAAERSQKQESTVAGDDAKQTDHLTQKALSNANDVQAAIEISSSSSNDGKTPENHYNYDEIRDEMSEDSEDLEDQEMDLEESENHRSYEETRNEVNDVFEDREDQVMDLEESKNHYSDEEPRDEVSDDSVDLEEQGMSLEDSDADEDDDYDPENLVVSPAAELEPHQDNQESVDDDVDDYEPTEEIEVLPKILPPELNVDEQQRSVPGQTEAESHEETRPSSAAASYSAQDHQNSSEEMEEDEEDDDYEPPDVAPGLSQDGSPVSDPATGITPGTSATPQIDETIETEYIPPAISPLTQEVVPRSHQGYSGSEESVNPTAISHQHFVPYTSALRQFTSYRFHPDFTNQVPGGYKSVTYSHKINPNVQLCKWEVAGGVCNDPHCRDQHFKDIPISDNNLLLQLGSVDEGSTPADKEAYKVGLRETLNSMRARNLKDVDAIAAEIVAYRRQFLGDSSRVLANLNIS